MLDESEGLSTFPDVLARFLGRFPELFPLFPVLKELSSDDWDTLLIRQKGQLSPKASWL